MLTVNKYIATTPLEASYIFFDCVSESGISYIHQSFHLNIFDTQTKKLLLVQKVPNIVRQCIQF